MGQVAARSRHLPLFLCMPGFVLLWVLPPQEPGTAFQVDFPATGQVVVGRVFQSADYLDYAEEKQKNRCNLRHLRIKQHRKCTSGCKVSGGKAGFQSMRYRVIALYREYPLQFWVVVATAFVDRIGSALLFPFFALYVSARFDVGMTQVGVLFALFSVSNFFGSMLGGALTDHMGRKTVILVGLLVSGVTSVLMGLVTRLAWFYVMGMVAGLFAEAAEPAHQALLTDLLPEEKRADGFGLMRVAANLAIAIGPAIGGLLAARSYMTLFIADAVTSALAAVLFYRLVRETRPAGIHPQHGEQPSGLKDSFRGYRDVVRDGAFMTFMVVSMLSVLVYIQMYSTLSVYLRDVHGVAEQGFGIIMSLNASMVVLFQFAITRRVSRWPAMLVMALGSVLYAIGFALYGFVSAFWLFLAAMAIITLGEMVVVPVAQAVVAKFAPEDKRGRYMAVFGVSWMLPGAAGPLLAGVVMDNFDPRWVWYLAGVLGMVATLGFVVLHWKVESAEREASLPLG
ncbi:MAG: MFS transporter [Anaerolineae bacterium]|nr:MAG: MFS transporter [Anaerolineae bacterium]